MRMNCEIKETRKTSLMGRTVRQHQQHSRHRKGCFQALACCHDLAQMNRTTQVMKSIREVKLLMTYDVLTRNPVPVLPFLVDRLNIFGVPARETDNEPGAISG